MRPLRKMRLLPLIGATFFMVAGGGPFGLEDILSMAGFGRALLILLIVPLLWSLPVALMVGELASALPEEGGFYCWVRRALGPFWGFQEAWLSLAASVFDMALYPTTFVLYLSRVLPAMTSGHRSLWLKLAMVAACCVWNLRGAAIVGESSVVMMLLSLSPFAALVVAGFWKAAHGGLGLPHAVAHPALDLAGAVSIAMWNNMGADNASTVAQEMDDPQRNYPRAMLGSVLLVTCVYVLPLAAVWAAGVPAERFTTGAWVDAARLLNGPWLAVSMVAVGAMCAVGTFNALALTLTRLPYALAGDGLLPRLLRRKNARGVPWVAVLVCSAGWALALNLSFERLISIDLVLYGGSLLLEFAALAVLRRREPQLRRPFRVPFGAAGLLAVTAGPVLLIGIAMWAARGERVAHLNALVFSLLVTIAGAAVYVALRPTRGASSLPERRSRPAR